MIADIPDVSVLWVWGMGFVMGMAGFLLGCRASNDLVEKEQNRLAALDGARAEAAKRQQKQIAEDARRTKNEAEQASQLAVAQAIELAKKQVDECYRTTLSTGDMEQLATQLKDSQLRFSRTGQVLTVRVFAVTTGWIAFEWILDPKQPNYLMVAGKRDGHIVFAENAYRGIFTDILERGREYRFHFSAMGQHRNHEHEDFKFVVRIPTRREWRRHITEAPPAPPEVEPDPTQRVKEKIDAMRAVDEFWKNYIDEQFQRIDVGEGTDTEKKHKKATVIARVQQERDKQEGHGQ